ncbi:MAG: hypothetical protein U9R23_07455 [Candidatus Cloacimonadota bacterium]|nr:hypothetical protein [Candidatus Cloacimonadota bacterium]
MKFLINPIQLDEEITILKEGDIAKSAVPLADCGGEQCVAILDEKPNL